MTGAPGSGDKAHVSAQAGNLLQAAPASLYVKQEEGITAEVCTAACLDLPRL